MSRVRYDNDNEIDGLRLLLGQPIEALEAEGQRRLVKSTQLPVHGSEDPRWATFGLKFGERPTDDIFRDVELPHGWRLEPTEHPMWSALVDEKGRKRAAVFYKAAFYDRSAHMRVCDRFTVERDYEDDAVLRTCVYESGSVLFATAAVPRPVIPDRYSAPADVRVAALDARNAAEAAQVAECEAWLDANRPKWRDPIAQWED